MPLKDYTYQQVITAIEIIDDLQKEKGGTDDEYTLTQELSMDIVILLLLKYSKKIK